jgi:hypothetical protein
MESTYIRFRVIVVPLGCTHSTPPLCSALSPQCPFVVVSDVTWSLMSVALTTVQMGMVLSVQLVLQLVVQLPPVRLMALHQPWRALSLFSERRLDFLTEWMVDTFRRWETFLPLFELLVSFLQMSALGAASTDMLLSLSMLLLESSSESLASCYLGVLVCTRCTFPTNRCDLTNLTLPPLLSLSEDLSGDVAGFDVNPCSCMKWTFLSSADAKVVPQFFS